MIDNPESRHAKAAILEAVVRGTLSRYELFCAAVAALWPGVGKRRPAGSLLHRGRDAAAAAAPMAPSAPRPRDPAGLTAGRSRWVNVEDFGAKGDGIADDTAALRAAIQAAKGDRARNIPGASIYLPGTYKVTSTIDLSGIAGLHFLGGNSGAGWAGYLGHVPQTLINGTAIKSGPVFKLSSPADGAGSGGSHTLQNLNILSGDVAVLITDTANHLLKNCSFQVNPGGATDNAPLVIENAFWVRWEDGSATAVRGKPAVILRGKSPHVAVNVTYLIELRKLIFNNGAVEYQQNTNMTGQVPQNFILDTCATENLVSPSALFAVAGTTHTWHGFQNVTFINCSHWDPTGSYLPLLYVGKGTTVIDVTMMGSFAPGYTAAQVLGNMYGLKMFSGGIGATADVVAQNRNPAYYAGFWTTNNGFTFSDASSLVGATNATSIQSGLGANLHAMMIRGAVAGESHCRVGVDGSGTHYWGPGGRTGGWDTHLGRVAPGVLGMPGSKAFNVPVVAADPPSPASGTIWYNSSAQALRCCVNGLVKTFALT